MEYRQNRGLTVSEIGMGCYGLGGAYGKKDPAVYRQVLRRAFDLGVTFFDSAEAYGDAERILGEALKPFRQQVYIATKVGVREGIKPNLKRDYVWEACERSLRQLQTDYIDLYQVHFDDPGTPVEETLEALESLVGEGKILRYGLGHLPLERVRQYMEAGNVFSVLLEFSAVERSAQKELIPLCIRHGAAAIAFSVTGRGILTGKIRPGVTFEPGDIRRMDPLFQRERFQSGLQIAGRLAELGQKYGKTAAQTAIAWVLAQPGIFCALTGPSTEEHLIENLGGSGWKIEQEDLAELEEFFRVEEENLRRQQRMALKEILSAPLPASSQAAFVDLVYVLETAISLGIASQDRILPVFYDLFGLRSSLDEPEARASLERIKSMIKDELPTLA